MSRARLLGAIRAGLAKSGFTAGELALLCGVEAVVRPHGCVVVGLGPAAVNVVGDARAYTPAVVVAFPADLDHARIAAISTDVTNRVRVSRVLMQAGPTRSTWNA